jgi:hypothetical protein
VPERKDYSGEKIGDWKIVGDTGLTSKHNGQIVIAKNLITGEYKEITPGNLRNGKKTSQMKQLADQNLKKIEDKYRKDGIMINKLTEKIRSNNTTGVKGVYWDKSVNKWRAKLTFKGKVVLNRTFYTKEEAIAARLAAEEKYFKPILEKYNQTKGED